MFHAFKNISKIRKNLTFEATNTLVHAVVMSHLDYCNSLSLDISDTHINKLQIVQNYAARVITKTPRRDHITLVLKSLPWVPVKNRIVFKNLVLVYQSLPRLSPTYIQDFVVPYKPLRPLQSHNQNVITVNKCHTFHMVMLLLNIQHLDCGTGCHMELKMQQLSLVSRKI